LYHAAVEQGGKKNPYLMITYPVYLFRVHRNYALFSVEDIARKKQSHVILLSEAVKAITPFACSISQHCTIRVT
jgi:hypothetical protein